MDVSGKKYVSSEKSAWETQLEKDPSTWTSEERKRYEDFIEWDQKETERKRGY